MKVISTLAEFKEARRRIAGTSVRAHHGLPSRGTSVSARRAKAENDASVVRHLRQSTQFRAERGLRQVSAGPGPRPGPAGERATDLVLMHGSGDVPPGISTWVDVEEVTKSWKALPDPGISAGWPRWCQAVQHRRANQGLLRPEGCPAGVVIQKMVTDLNMNLESWLCHAARTRRPGHEQPERLLSPEERQAAVVLWRSMNLARGCGRRASGTRERYATEMVPSSRRSLWPA